MNTNRFYKGNGLNEQDPLLDKRVPKSTLYENDAEWRRKRRQMIRWWLATVVVAALVGYFSARMRSHAHANQAGQESAAPARPQLP